MKKEEYQEIPEDVDFDPAVDAAIIANSGNAPPPVEKPELKVNPFDAPPETPETIDGLPPVPPELMPWGEQQAAAPTGGRGRGADPFKNLIPSNDRLMIFKISQHGHKGYIGDYGIHDVERSRGLEAFIQTNLAPTYGAGEYVVEVRGVDNKIKKQGMVSIVGPSGQKTGSPTIQELLAVQQTYEKNAKQNATGQLSEMMQMMTMFDKMFPKNEKGSDGSMTMMLMFMMMQNMNKQNTSDPMTGLLLQRINQLEQQTQLPPPLPPFMQFPPPLYSPPPEHTSSSISEIVKIMGEVMRASHPPTQQNDLLITMLSKMDHNSLNMKDIMTLLPTIKEMISTKSESTFNEYLEALLKLDELRGDRIEDKSMWAGLAEMATGVYRDIVMRKMELEMGAKNLSGQTQRPTPTLPRSTPTRELQGVAERPKPRVPEIPISFRQYTTRMIQAHQSNNEPGLIMALLEGLFHLRERSAEWMPYIDEMMMSAASGDKQRAMKFIEVFLHTFARKKLIPVEVVGRAKTLVDENWETILEKAGITKVAKEMTEAKQQTTVAAPGERQPEPVVGGPGETPDKNGTEDDGLPDERELGEEGIDPTDLPEDARQELEKSTPAV